MISFVRVYLFVVCVLLTDSCIADGFMNAPCVDGFDTKSQQINSKSSCTSTTPSFLNSLTDPNPLLEIPNVMPALNSSLRILPDGVPNI